MIPKRALGRTGIVTTTLGLGGGPLGWTTGDDADAAAEATLDAAWSAGVRCCDTAPYYGYGRSERRIGRWLSSGPRPGLVLSTKVGRLIEDGARVVYDYSRDGALRSVEASLGRLGLERIDVLLIHDIDRYTHGADQPARFREALAGAWVALTELKAQGVVRAIGLGVNDWTVCAAFAEAAPLDCVLLAGRYTLLERGAAGFLDLAAARGIGVFLGGPFNSGILATGPVEGALHDYVPASAAVRARVARLEAALGRFGAPLPAAALQFPLRHPAVACVVAGLASPHEVAQAAAWMAPLDEACWRALDAEVPAHT